MIPDIIDRAERPRVHPSVVDDDPPLSGFLVYRHLLRAERRRRPEAIAALQLTCEDFLLQVSEAVVGVSFGGGAYSLGRADELEE